MPDDRSARCPRRITLRGQILLLVGAYVLSIGPMFWQWYEAENFGTSTLLRVFYAPLRLLCGVPVVEEWLNRYINWWIA